MTTTPVRAPHTQAMLAISALEDWRPSERDAAVLDLVDAGAPAWRIAAAIRATLGPGAFAPVRVSPWARRRPYLQRGSEVLANSLGVTDAEELARAEGLFALAGGARLLSAAHVAAPDVATVHTELFADVYAWAGETRTVDLTRGGSRFVPASRIRGELAAVGRVADALAVTGTVASGAAGSAEEVVSAGVVSATMVSAAADALGRWYAAFNRVHPFREGNGRASAVAMTLAARRVGVDLDFSRTTRERWVRAAIDSLAGGSRTTVDPGPHLREFAAIVVARRAQGT